MARVKPAATRVKPAATRVKPAATRVKPASTRPKPARASTGSAATPIGDLPCPRCHDGRMLAGKRGWGCTRWRLGCGFVVWFETAGRTLSESQLRDLVVRGQTRRARFTPSGGAPTDGRLVLDVGGDGGARFTSAEPPPKSPAKRTT